MATAQSYRRLALEFSTADAEQPQIDYRDETLVLQFLDWQEKTIKVRFPSAVAFRWQNEVPFSPDFRDDLCYEVLASVWLAELQSLNAVDSQHRHYKLCFNAAGVLDVISHDLE